MLRLFVVAAAAVLVQAPAAAQGTFAEAQAYCHWAGKRLPADAEWLEAAHVERRA